MRKDVKVGMALSLVVVVLAGWYYTRDDKSDQAIPLADGEAATEGVEPVEVEETAAEVGAPRWGEPASVLAEAPDGARTDDVLAAVTPVETAEAEQGSLESAGEGAGEDEESAGDAAEESGLAESDRPSDQVGLPPSDNASAVVREDDRPPSPPTEAGAVPDESLAETSDAIVRRGWRPEGQTDDAAVELYTVQPGDTFAIVAEVYYGSQRHARFLMEANPQIEDERHLRAGCTIEIPPLPESRRQLSRAADKRAAAGAPTDGARTYTVQPGDSFYRIAKRFLGAGSLWSEIFELNKDLVDEDPKGLRPGMVLTLPPE